MPQNARYRITIIGVGNHHSGDPGEAKTDADYKLRMVLRELIDAGHDIKEASMEMFDDTEQVNLIGVEDIKPRHHNIVANIVVDKKFMNLPPEQILAAHAEQQAEANKADLSKDD